MIEPKTHVCFEVFEQTQKTKKWLRKNQKHAFPNAENFKLGVTTYVR